MYLAVRTGPMQSYANPAERCMSCLNLALQNVTLCRESTGFEMRMKSLTSLTKLRKAADRDPRLKDAYAASVQPVLEILKERFKKLRWQEGEVTVHVSAQQESIDEIESLLKVLEPELEDIETPVAAFIQQNFENLDTLKDFFKNPCRCHNYTFQVKKCCDPGCAYCTLNPVRLSEELFSQLHFLPDPMLGPDGNTYLPFEDVYGTETTDEGRPSLSAKPQATANDKLRKGLLVADKVRSIVPCAECGKPRAIYSRRKLTAVETAALDRQQEVLLYICGDQLFPTGPHKDTMVMKGLNCQSPVETTYYAGKTAAFPDVCFHCGNPNNFSGPAVQQQKEEFGIVRPICDHCLHQGKDIVCRNAL